MKTVQILMSTYNGSRFLREQLDSILKQDCENRKIAGFSLLIRDDGSSDGTQDILSEYEMKYPDCITWYQGENIGVTNSFFELLAQSDEEADYIAFSDQDDVWLPEKISSGILKLMDMENSHSDSALRPLLYCCRPLLVDVDLKEIPSKIDRQEIKAGFGNALIENIVTGCTIIMNRRLREFICMEFPKDAMLHDRWIYLVASCFGDIYFDEESYILYRQHGGNAVGISSGKMAELKYRLKNFFNRKGAAGRQAEEFYRIFGEELSMQPENLKLLQMFLEGKKSFRVRNRLIRGSKLYRQRKSDCRIAKLILLLNWY